MQGGNLGPLVQGGTVLMYSPDLVCTIDVGVQGDIQHSLCSYKGPLKSSNSGRVLLTL